MEVGVLTLSCDGRPEEGEAEFSMLGVLDNWSSRNTNWRTLQAICSFACSQISNWSTIYMVPRKSTQLLNVNTTKFQLER